MRLCSSLYARLAVALAFTATAAAAQTSPRADLIVGTGWLAEHLHDADLVLLHVGDRGEYEKSHIPGARFVSQGDVSVSNHDQHDDTGLMLEMPSADTLRARLAALGIGDRSKVVVYYGNDWVSPATRVMFTLDYAGLGSRSALLDGGMSRWKAENRQLTAEVPPRALGSLSALHVKPIVVDIAFVRGKLGTPSFHLIDGRAAVFYDGVEAGGPRKGHIIGARSVPFTEVTTGTLQFKSPAELERLFSGAGVNPGDTVVAYCHIGQQATAVLFAARTLGHPVLLYDGSFQEWGRRTDLPIENPAAGGAKKQ